MDQIILLEAEKILRATSAKSWDSIGFDSFKSKYSKLDEDSVSSSWKQAIQNMKRTNRTKFYAYAGSGGEYASMTDKEIEDEKNRVILTEVEKWDEMIRFRRVERIADTIVFLTTKNASFEITTDDLFTQTKFRQACMKGTNVKLPEITRPAFEAFTDRLKFEVVEGFSISKKIIVKEALRSLSLRMKEHVFDDKKEAIIFAVKKGVSVFDNYIFFKLTTLIDEVRTGGRTYDQATLLVALKQLNAKNDRISDGAYWVYDLNFNDDEEYDDMGEVASKLSVQAGEDMEDRS
jgi:hypothetical protein